MNYFTKDKPYNSLNEYYKKHYGFKVAKVPLNAGFTCPNKDGKKGIGGCTYCSKLGSGDFAGDIKLSIKDQYNQIKQVMINKWPNTKFMPYFQANSNTYKPLEDLKKLYNEAINADTKDNIVGLSIATRADCLPLNIINYLGELNKKIHIQVELGLQSSNEKTGIKINRCSTNEEFITAVNNLRSHNIEVVVHIINGLPYETKQDMLNTIHFINKLDIQGIKIHSLLVLKNTKLANEFENEHFPLLTLEEYVDIVCEQIKLLKDTIIIHRLAADGVKDDLIGPLWTVHKLVVMNEIDKKLRKTNSYQGMNFNQNHSN